MTASLNGGVETPGVKAFSTPGVNKQQRPSLRGTRYRMVPGDAAIKAGLKHMNIQAITEQIITRSQLQELNFVLADISGNVFSTKKTFEKRVKEALPFNLSTALLAYCKKNRINIKNPRQTQQALEKLIQELKKLPIIRLTLAWEPSAQDLEDISNWIHFRRAHLGGGGSVEIDHILDIQIDPTIFAGAIVQYNGKYGDYSLKQKVSVFNPRS